MSILATPSLAYSKGDALPHELFGFEVVDVIGEGAGSVIYAVSHPETRQLYALKHVVRRNEKDIRFVEQLENEYEMTRRFSHPALRRALECRINRTLLRRVTDAMLLMELFHGLPLETEPVKDLPGKVDLFAQVAEG